MARLVTASHAWCQLDNSLESALRCVSEALHVWLGVRVLRSSADIGWFMAQAAHLGTLYRYIYRSPLLYLLTTAWW